MNEEKKAIQEIIKTREEIVNFFSNDFKKEREKWSVGEFLRNLQIDFDIDELKPIDDQVPDIIFRKEEFEVKEVDKEGRRRHDEKKQALKKVQAASTLKDTLSPYEFREIHLQEIVDRIHKELKKFPYSPDFCKKTNILFYINYDLIGEPCFTIPERIIWEKWRSVSMFTNDNISFVFWVGNDAPEFLKLSTGRVIRNRK